MGGGWRREDAELTPPLSQYNQKPQLGLASLQVQKRETTIAQFHRKVKHQLDSQNLGIHDALSTTQYNQSPLVRLPPSKACTKLNQ